MLLYKNVDICDLSSILERGILSIDELGHSNWDNGKRSCNATNVVYLFEPVNERNSFVNYGLALLEIDVHNSAINEFSEIDINRGKYIEHTVPCIPPESIKRIFIPKIFRDRVALDDFVLRHVTWCDIYAEVYHDDPHGAVACSEATEDEYLLLSKARLNTTEYCYFRGINNKNEVIDYYNVRYIIDGV